MHSCSLLLLACTIWTTSAWSQPFYPIPRAVTRVTRFAPPPHQQRMPIRSADPENKQWQRLKRDHDDYFHNRDDHDDRGSSGVTGPVHTFVKTDKNANYKWGVRHHVGNKFAS